jgi:hypothetical protein
MSQTCVIFAKYDIFDTVRLVCVIYRGRVGENRRFQYLLMAISMC